nr:MAG TPA: hypothetical protein [Inoviridae sp.]DAQ17131.1 MAG TPA: hypothetical protein [Inoviridae sp.]DAW75024.1 MAG TPA: hypothetical protein [Inoviridae sp.]
MSSYLWGQSPYPYNITVILLFSAINEKGLKDFLTV